MITEAFKGQLGTDGNRTDRVNPYAGLTARLTSRAGTKVGVSDPLIARDSVRAQRIKATPGITG